MSVVEFILENNNISYTQLRSDQKRGKNIIKLTVDALKEEVFPNDLRITWKVYAGDCPIEFDNISKDKYTFSTVEVAGKSHLAYPCFMFDNWKDCGILDYEDLINSLSFKGLNISYKYNSIFWRGATSNPKTEFCELGKKYTWLDAYCIFDKKYNIAKQHCQTRIELSDHIYWKYLADISGGFYGNCYSARLKALMFSNRVLFIQNRPCGDMTYDLLKDGENCIFIKEDFSDLEEKYKWIEGQGEIFQQEMAGKLFNEAQKHCRRKNAHERIRKLIYNMID